MSDVQPAATATGWLIDCHVHIHPSFPLETFLDGAFASMRRAARGAPGMMGALCVTDARGQRGFERLRCSRGTWAIEETDEAASYIVRSRGDALAVIAGRQAATAEKLEVLQLGSAADLPDGEPVGRALERARMSGGLAVLPWGFGKWTSRRGTLVREMIVRDDGSLTLGDTGNRPDALPDPAAFRAARPRGIPILPGSDPLPLSAHASRAGSCGIRLACVPDLSRPARQMLELLAVRGQPPTFCTRSSLGRFVIDQAMIRFARGSAALRDEG